MFTAGGKLKEKEIEGANISIIFTVGRMKGWGVSVKFSKDGVEKRERFCLELVKIATNNANMVFTGGGGL